jgi:hypothetical protein
VTHQLTGAVLPEADFGTVSADSSLRNGRKTVKWRLP